MRAATESDMAPTRRSTPGRRWLMHLSLCLGLLFQLSSQQRDPIKDFCRRFGHQAAIVDRKVYIDGGLVNWNPMDQDPGNYTNSWLIYHDLDTYHEKMPQIYANLSKNASVPSVHGGALWADDVNYRLFMFGGEFHGGSSLPTTFNLLSYDIWYNQWDNLGPVGAGIQRVSYGASTNVAERGEGYFYGGYLSNTSVPGWQGPPSATKGLIRYRMDGNSWMNLTGPDTIGRAEGVMVSLPVSDGGMLVYFGGVQDIYRNGTMVPQPMDQIFLYDIISNRWHIQTANGTIPEYRKRFCAGAVWAKDKSSYNIYLNAGAGFGGLGYDDVYVLSLPSFTWIKTYPLDRNGTGEYPSHSLTCTVVNDGAQMLTIGGSFPKDNACDYEQVWGVHNMDLGNRIPNNFQKVWAEYVPTLTGYGVPDFVTQVIGGNENGSATKLVPAAGFVNHDLGILLGMKATFPNRTRANDGRVDPAKAAAGADTGANSGLSTGAIAGIAVGGAVALVTLLAALWAFCRKRKTPLQPTAEGQQGYNCMSHRSATSHYYGQSPSSAHHMSPLGSDGATSGPADGHWSWRPAAPSEMEGTNYTPQELDAGSLPPGHASEHMRPGKVPWYEPGRGQEQGGYVLPK